MNAAVGEIAIEPSRLASWRTLVTVPRTRSRTRAGNSPKTTVSAASGATVRISVGVMSVRWWPRPFRNSDSSPKTSRWYIHSR
jgi:hypothetical protein